MFIIYCLFSVVVKLSESSVFSIIIGHFFFTERGEIFESRDRQMV